MIDPDGIILTKENLKSDISLGQIPDYDYITFDLDDDKEFEKYVKCVKAEVRGSFEYRQLMAYLKEYMGMDTCSFIRTATSRDGSKVRIEIHHYPFGLHDIILVVIRKRQYYHESLEIQMVAKEVMCLHYKTMVGLISLSETVHELVHSGKLFIPVGNVYGRYNLFVDYYKPFFKPEQLEVLARIEKYSMEEAQLLDTTILNENLTTIHSKSEEYQLPNMEVMNQGMWNRIQTIKDNGYVLPNVRDKAITMKEKEQDQKQRICPIHFDESVKQKIQITK